MDGLVCFVNGSGGKGDGGLLGWVESRVTIVWVCFIDGPI
jgi:hypothetical protein